MLLYLFFLVSVLVLGSFLIGPLTGRVWMVVLMFFYILFFADKNKLKSKNVYTYMSVFVIYIFLLFLAQIVNGDMARYGISWLLANHFVSIVAFIATYYIIITKSQKMFEIVIITLMVLLSVDSIITILQYDNNEVAWGINMTITQGRNEQLMEFMESSVGYQDTLAGIAKTPGIFNSVVINAIFLASFGILPFCFFQNKSKYLKILSLVVIALTLAACFVCQERAALMVYSASLMFLYLKNSNTRSTGILLFIIICFVLINFGPSFFDFGRYEEKGMFTNDIREDIWGHFGAFFQNNWMWGGASQFEIFSGGHMPHNIFLNAFVFGGILGGLVIISLLFVLLIRIYRNVFTKRTTKITRVAAMALLSILAQSFVHNMSLVSGDVLTFILLGLMTATEEAKDIGKVAFPVKKKKFSLYSKAY